MNMPKKSGIFLDKFVWKENTYYVLEVAYNKNNPIHRKIFYSGFLDKSGKPSTCSQFFDGNDNGATYNTSLEDIYYGRVIFEIPLKIDNP